MKTIFRIIMVIIVLLPLLYAQKAPDTVWEKRINGGAIHSQQNRDGGLIVTRSENEDDKIHIIQKENRMQINDKNFSNDFLLSEQLYQEWSDTNWLDISKLTYYYDENNNLIERLRYVGYGTGLNNNMKSNFKYDENKNLIEELEQVRMFTLTWQNYHKFTSSYDENNNLIENLRQYWTGDTWQSYFKCTDTYDENNNLINSLTQEWDGTNWVNEDWFIFTYDENNNLIEGLDKWWIDSRWHDAFLWICSYDKNNRLIQELTKQWQGNSCVNYLKCTYSYDDNNNLIEELYLTYQNDWINEQKNLYEYDGKNNLIQWNRQSWDNPNWEDEMREIYNYDASSNRIETIEQYWEGYWKNQHRYIYSYIPVTEIGNPFNVIGDFTLSQNYPNPFNPTTTIEFTLPKSEYVELKVYNVLGKEVSTLVSKKLNQGNHIYTFDGKNLASGIYYYQLTAGDYREVKKMILLR